jgi:hypothetical protein
MSAGQRWRLSYEIRVPKASSQLVVQLYATTVSGDSATLRVRSAQLSMNEGAALDGGVDVLEDEVSTAPR